MKAISEDANKIVQNFKSSYGGEQQNTELNSIQQLSEMIDIIFDQGAHETLGQSPAALHEVFILIRDRMNEARTKFDEFEMQKE